MGETMDNVTLSVKNVSKSYQDNIALNNVSFSVGPGEIVGLLGHNGAGKSTLIKCIMGVLQTYSGEIHLFGSNVKDNNEIVSSKCGFLLEPAFCNYLSAFDNLSLLADMQGVSRNRVIDLLEVVSLKKAAKKRVSEFSFGMKQRLGLAQALLNSPALIVLDEPTVGLDPFGIKLLKEMLKDLTKNGVTVLFSSHQLKDVEDICNRIIVLDHGEKTRDNLVESLTGRKVITLEIEGNAKFALALISRIDDSIEIHDPYIKYSNTEITNEIISILSNHQIKIRDIEVQQEDALQKLLFEKRAN